MNDLISRQAVIELWDKYHPYIATKAIEYDEELRALPSAQLERKKGKWIKRGSCLFRCSECGRFSPTKENFCPTCGLDMIEDNDNIPMEYYESGGI